MCTHRRCSDNRLSGTLPAEWGRRWSEVEEIDMGNNSLSGSYPVAWSGMTHLKNLLLKCAARGWWEQGRLTGRLACMCGRRSLARGPLAV